MGQRYFCWQNLGYPLTKTQETSHTLSMKLAAVHLLDMGGEEGRKRGGSCIEEKKTGPPPSLFWRGGVDTQESLLVDPFSLGRPLAFKYMSLCQVQFLSTRPT